MTIENGEIMLTYLEASKMLSSGEANPPKFFNNYIKGIKANLLKEADAELSAREEHALYVKTYDKALKMGVRALERIDKLELIADAQLIKLP